MKKLVFTLAIVFMLTSTASAADGYWSRAGGLFVDGIVSIVKSPLDLVIKTKDVVVASDQHVADPFKYVFGLAQGLYVALDSISTGAINIAGSLIPEFQGIDSIYIWES